MANNAIKICSLNCQGLGDINKRRDVLHFLRNRGFSIICLQDTHFSKVNERLLVNEWGFKAVFSSNNSRSRGVAIYFNNTFELKILNTFCDNNGNLLMVNIELNKKDIFC